MQLNAFNTKVQVKYAVLMQIEAIVIDGSEGADVMSIITDL